jgi:DNA-binding MarR family transcriptional regulator
MEMNQTIFLMQQNFATLFALANKVQGKSDQYLKHLTSRQLMTMIAIGHLPEDEASLNNIARKLGTTKQSARQLVMLLEEKGFVCTTPSPRDKRALNVSVTSTGSQVLYEDFMLGMEFFNQLFHEFSQTELETLWNLLKKLYRFDGEEQDGFEGGTHF